MTNAWIKIVVLSIGGALGVNARYWQAVWMARWAPLEFPWATFAINVTGSFLIGLSSAVLVHRFPGNDSARLFVVVGFLGGYTTFSSYTLEAMGLIERDRPFLGAIYLGGSVLFGLGSAALGLAIGRLLATPS
ncbi:fluoride efflux transporter FluC [Paludisphaera rhizosphaerae]|uniref:fluoride efflux transporter FluC n=1 Tax=Paludisphaera rhizosphaerae TaxID=2711216 RepID=UPI0013ED9769|nr:CrcB family protein [Paludisphaera rhizosphaerae]